MTAPAPCFVGLMSGTSGDGVDGVLARFSGAGLPEVLAHVHRPFDPSLRQELLALNRSGPDELHRAARAAIGVSTAYAAVVRALLQQADVSASTVCALGAHGQTVRHQPSPQPAEPNIGRAIHSAVPAEPGYTLQLLNGAWLAEQTGIDVICDLRSADIAAGGQGAPLVPAAHQDWFAQERSDVAVLNLGGMANLSLLPARQAPAQRPVLGFDCGPGNVLMDAWCERHLGTPFDDKGQWAAQGTVKPTLLQHLLADPFFALPPPKSTGRELFDTGWLDAHLLAWAQPAAPVDVQATLAELTARAAAEALLRHGPDSIELLVCGGGARNTHVMTRLQSLLPGKTVTTSASRGLPVDQVEALAFAWLAQRFICGLPGNVPAVTGARGPRRLGALYPKYRRLNVPAETSSPNIK